MRKAGKRRCSLVTQVISLVEVTSYTGYVIDSDATNASAGYTRDSIAVYANTMYGNTSASMQTNSYDLQFRLLDEGGIPHTIFNVGGAPDTKYVISFTNIMPGLTGLSLEHEADLAPTTRLDPAQRYQVEARLMETDTAVGDILRDEEPVVPVLGFRHSITLRAAMMKSMSFPAGRGVLQANLPDGVRSLHDAFLVESDYTLQRYDDFSAAITTNVIGVRLDYILRDSAGVVIPLLSNSTSVSQSIPSYTLGVEPAGGSGTRDFAVRPGLRRSRLRRSDRDHEFRDSADRQQSARDRG